MANEARGLRARLYTALVKSKSVFMGTSLGVNYVVPARHNGAN